MGIEKYKDAFEVRMHPDQLNLPYTWKHSKTHTMCFRCSPSDLKG
jgi:hypothetical protein